MEASKLLKTYSINFPKEKFRIGKISGKIQKLFGKRWLTFCEHLRIQYQCKECGGSKICEHNHRRFFCKKCGGAGICQHNRERYKCKDCGGPAFCQHNRRRSECKECGGHSFCEHQRLRYTCKECGGSQICEHRRLRYTCKECGGSQICEHQRIHHACKECGGSQICEHQHVRRTCKECGGRGICEHQCLRYTCKECGGPAICEHQHIRYQCRECLQTTCSVCNIDVTSRLFKFKVCYNCGIWAACKSPLHKRQDKIFQFIEKEFENLDIQFDLQLPNQNCSKKRPDVLITTLYRRIIIEVDENQHKNIPISCEMAYFSDQLARLLAVKELKERTEMERMNEIVSSGEIIPTTFIRFNPDNSIDENRRKRKVSEQLKLEALKNEIQNWLDPDYNPPNGEFAIAVFLYYDGKERFEKEIPISYEQIKTPKIIDEPTLDI